MRTAHRYGIYVILDIILNHSGNVFSYAPDRYVTQVQAARIPIWTRVGMGALTRWLASMMPAAGPALPFGPVDRQKNRRAWPHGAIWPQEFQEPATFSALGRINNWDNDPEFMQEDFFDLKDIRLGTGDVDDYTPSSALWALCHVYKSWIAYADVDGFRVDTVKHMDPGATRFFTSVIDEFAQNLGKENFYLIGEMTRAASALQLETTGMDAAVGIDDIPDKLENLVKGYRNGPDISTSSATLCWFKRNSHIWFRNKVVTLFDDHDQVRKGGYKARSAPATPAWPLLLLNVVALNATTLGIPCIDHGSEQGFDGEGDSDRYIREAMFGGEFGAFHARAGALF